MKVKNQVIERSEIAFIFDLDGTLFDSKNQILRALSSARDVLDFPQLPRATGEKLIGLPAKLLFADLDLELKTLDDAVVLFRQHLRSEILRQNDEFDGAHELILELKRLGVRLGVATAKPENLANAVVENSNLNGLFDHVQGTDGFPSKPNPQVVLRCMNSLESKTAVMVGDRIEDLEAGQAADVLTIGLAQSVFSKSDLELAGATWTFDKIANIKSALPEIIERLSAEG